MAKASVSNLADNAYARKALDAIAAIEQEAQKRKLEQVNVLRDALKNIDQRISELQHQRQQVEDAIEKIMGKSAAPVKATKKRGRVNHQELRGRVVNWMSSHPGVVYTAVQLHEEFPELDGFASIAAFLKQPIADGVIIVDKSGGNRNTRYSAPVKQA